MLHAHFHGLHHKLKGHSAALHGARDAAQAAAQAAMVDQMAELDRQRQDSDVAQALAAAVSPSEAEAGQP